MSTPNFRRIESAGPDETGLQLASRMVALLKSGRSYSVKHVAFTQQLENFLVLLQPLLRASGVLRFEARDGELHMNGERMPLRSPLARQAEFLVSELEARTIAGLEFTSVLTLPALVAFMEMFVAGERWKGEELVHACQAAGIDGVRALSLVTLAASAGAAAATDELPEALGASRAAWAALYAGTQQLLSGDALDHGIELRHLKRLAQPVVEAVLQGERITAALAHVTPGETVWAHAMHVALAAISTGAQLGLTRRDLADVAIAALLHDAGHDWGASALDTDDRPHAPHAREGLRRMAWVTTLNRNSLDAMRTTLEHHDPLPSGPSEQPPALLSQLVGIADAYVTLLSHGGPRDQRMSPAGALTRVIGPLRSYWHPALSIALVQALGLHPPGQVVELDDGSIARIVVPVPGDPERPWIQVVVDDQGRGLPKAARQLVLLPDDRHITRDVPILDWPAGMDRSAA